MCGLCGLWGETAHWTSVASALPRAQQATDRDGLLRARQVQRHSINRVCRAFGTSIADWNATSWIVTSASGATEIVGSLPELWRAVESVSKRAIDPLDAALLDALERQCGTRDSQAQRD